MKKLIVLMIVIITSISMIGCSTSEVPQTSPTPTKTAEIEWKHASEKMNLENYNKLEIGMTYEEVVDLFGSEGTFSPPEKDECKVYTWAGHDGGVAWLVFRDGILSGFTEDRLK